MQSKSSVSRKVEKLTSNINQPLVKSYLFSARYYTFPYCFRVRTTFGNKMTPTQCKNLAKQGGLRGTESGELGERENFEMGERNGNRRDWRSRLTPSLWDSWRSPILSKVDVMDGSVGKGCIAVEHSPVFNDPKWRNTGAPKYSHARKYGIPERERPKVSPSLRARFSMFSTSRSMYQTGRT